MRRSTASRVIGMWTRAMLDEIEPGWRDLELDLLDPGALRRDDAYIAHEDMVALWARYTDAHPDPLFGLHFAERHADRAVGIYAYAAAHAPDFATAARTGVQLQRLLDTHSELTMVAVDGGAMIRHLPPAGISRWPRHLAESFAGGMVHLSRTFSGRAADPREAYFQHAAGADTSAWFRCPVHHDQPWNALVFDRATLELRSRHADPTQFAAIVAAATRTLEALAPPRTFLDEARAALRPLGKKRASVAGLAAALGVSERTLQRRLAEAGATFRELLDGVRVELLAEQGLKGQKTAATANALGFADPSSIRRLRRRLRRPSR